ncbi:MAG: tRNA pseudouridine(13) synthase TruD [Planctomycetaceae bacterium]
MADLPFDLLSEDQLRQLQTFDFSYLTSDFAGIGGFLKEQPEDFVVEEIPLYQPCGEGEHLYLWIEKRNLSAPDLLKHVSQSVSVSVNDIGSAGLKDKIAITRQFLSVPESCELYIDNINNDQVQVLSATRHQNKLKTGHLQGNRFSILVREPHPEALERANLIRERIQEIGFPNYYGEQRFGTEGRTLLFGLKTLIKPPSRFRSKQVRFELSAVQSWLFNLALTRRIDDGLLRTVLAGDVMQVCQSGGPFVAEDVATEQSRLEADETVTSGPLYGPKMKMPTGSVLDRENLILEEAGLTREMFRVHRKLCPGSRRAYTIKPEALDFRIENEGIRFEFVLPAGCYATVLLREFMKSESLAGRSLREVD